MVIGGFLDFAWSQGGYLGRGREFGLEVSWSPNVQKFTGVETDARVLIHRSRSEVFELEAIYTPREEGSPGPREETESGTRSPPIRDSNLRDSPQKNWPAGARADSRGTEAASGEEGGVTDIGTRP